MNWSFHCQNNNYIFFMYPRMLRRPLIYCACFTNLKATLWCFTPLKRFFFSFFLAAVDFYSFWHENQLPDCWNFFQLCNPSQRMLSLQRLFLKVSILLQGNVITTMELWKKKKKTHNTDMIFTVMDDTTFSEWKPSLMAAWNGGKNIIFKMVTNSIL